MKVNLSRDIKLKKIELIAEVDFTDSENPYNELLKDVNSIDDLKRVMKNANLEESQINMIISKLEKIRVINNGKIYKNIISTKEYGKYEFIYIENDRLVGSFPITIHRIKPGRSNSITNISNNSIIKEINNSNKFYQSYINKKQNFKIVKLEKSEDKYLGINKGAGTIITVKWNLDLKNNKNNWYLEGNIKIEGKNKKENHSEKIIQIINHEKIDITDIRINSLLNNSWDNKNKAMNITFDEIDDKAKNSFYIDFNQNIQFDEFGKFSANFTDIPIIPIDKNNANIWFIYLFKNYIDNLDKYISFDELEQIWNNQFEKIPISKKFDLRFEFDDIVEEFKKGSKVYWQLMAGKDLNPFESIEYSTEKILNNIVIKVKNNIDIYDDVISKIDDKYFNKITIIDPYIINERHYKILKEIVSALEEDVEISIITKSNENEIVEKVNNELNINYKAINKRLPHDRFWIFDDGETKRYFNISKSIDFISYNRSRDSLNIKENTIFTELDKNDVEKRVFELLGEDNE